MPKIISAFPAMRLFVIVSLSINFENATTRTEAIEFITTPNL